MPSQPRVPVLAIEEDDLLVVAQAITLRCAVQAAEAARAARLRALAQIAAHLGRTLSTYARHALVNCQGTAGASDVETDTRLLAEALRVFSTEIQSVSSTYADALPPNARGMIEGPEQLRPATNAPMMPRRRERSDAVARALPH